MVLVQDNNEGNEHVIYYLSENLLDTETHYAHVEKLALDAIQVVQCFQHYILLCMTTVISECNPMTYILTRQLLEDKYSKWIVILHEFYLVFTTAQSNKSLVFTELTCSLPSKSLPTSADEQLSDETLFLISTLDPWYGDIIVYLQMSTFQSRGHGYIIITMDHFTKWAEAMPTYSVDGKTISRFLFNHVISRFGVPQAIVIDHGSHFRDYMMAQLTSTLGLRHDGSPPYYPQANDQVEVVNKVLVTMLQRTIGMHKSN
eukprot:PITA_32415